jgi:hypothetical protein
VSGRFFSRWGKRERVVAAWTVVVIVIVTGLEIVIAITVPGPQKDDFGADGKGLVLFLTFAGGLVAWGLGRGGIAAVAWFLDWRNDLRFIRKSRRNASARDDLKGLM